MASSSLLGSRGAGSVGGLPAAALALTLAVGSLSLGCAVDVPLGSSESAIVDGFIPDGRDEIVLLFRTDGASCSGALISPRLVLTAFHCVQGPGGAAASARVFRVLTGRNFNDLDNQYFVESVRTVPGASANFQTPTDLALLVLTEDASEPTLRVARSNPNTLIGQTITAVGWGQTPNGGAGRKLETTAEVAGLFRSGFIAVEPAVCSGDSGGPLIGESGEVYGVASFIFSPDGQTRPVCGTAPGAYNPVFPHLDFIDEVLEEIGACISDDPEVCDGVDNNCDGVIDEGCTPLGEPCQFDDRCFGGLCADTVIGRVCTEACDATRPTLGCRGGFFCGRLGCDGFCVPGEAGEGELFSECSTNTDCANLNCVALDDGTRRCLDGCAADTASCFGGEVCTAEAGSCGGCALGSQWDAPRGLGEACAVDGDCRSDICAERGGQRECAEPCAGDSCIDGFLCRDVPRGADGAVESLCLRDRLQPLGGICVDNSDCGGAACVTSGETGFCSVQCETDSECPRGFGCGELSGVRLCLPDLALDGEDCAGNAECASGLCATTGVCTRLCGLDEPCGPGLDCARVGTGTQAICVPAPEPRPVNRGCAASAAPGPNGLGWLSTALLALLVVRRRRRR